MRDALEVLGEKGGIMDAADETDIVANPNLARDLITDPALNVNNPNNPALTAGMTFLGQFLDYDMTFDPTSNLERQVDPDWTPTLPSATPDTFQMTDLLRFAGVVGSCRPLRLSGETGDLGFVSVMGGSASTTALVSTACRTAENGP